MQSVNFRVGSGTGCEKEKETYRIETPYSYRSIVGCWAQVKGIRSPCDVWNALRMTFQCLLEFTIQCVPNFDCFVRRYERSRKTLVQPMAIRSVWSTGLTATSQPFAIGRKLHAGNRHSMADKGVFQLILWFSDLYFGSRLFRFGFSALCVCFFTWIVVARSVVGHFFLVHNVECSSFCPRTRTSLPWKTFSSHTLKFPLFPPVGTSCSGHSANVVRTAISRQAVDSYSAR